MFDVGKAIGGGHLLDRSRMLVDWVVFQQDALLNLVDHREQVAALELGGCTEQRKHAAGERAARRPGPTS